MENDWPELMRLVESVQTYGSFQSGPKVVSELERVLLQYFSLEDEHLRLLNSLNPPSAKKDNQTSTSEDVHLIMGTVTPISTLMPRADTIPSDSSGKFVTVDLEELQQQLLATNREISTRDDLIRHLREELESLIAKSSVIPPTPPEDRTDLLQTKSRLTQEIEERVAIEAKLVELEERCRNDLETHTNNKAESQSRLLQLQSDLDELSSTIAKHQEQLATLQDTLKSEKRKVIGLTIRLACVKSALSRHRSENKEVVHRLSDQNEDLSLQLTIAQKEINRLHELIPSTETHQDGCEGYQMSQEVLTQLQTPTDGKFDLDYDHCKILEICALEAFVIPQRKRSTNLSLSLLKSAASTQPTLDALCIPAGETHPDRRGHNYGVPEGEHAHQGMARPNNLAHQNAKGDFQTGAGGLTCGGASGTLAEPTSNISAESRRSLVEKMLDNYQRNSSQSPQTEEKSRMEWLEEFVIHSDNLLATKVKAMETYKCQLEEAKGKTECLEKNLTMCQQKLNNIEQENSYIEGSLLKVKEDYRELVEEYDKLKRATKGRQPGQTSDEGRPKASTTMNGILGQIGAMF